MINAGTKNPDQENRNKKCGTVLEYIKTESNA